MEQHKLFPGEMSLTAHSLWIKMPSVEEARELLQSQALVLAASAKKLDKFDARIFYPGCHQPFRVLATMINNHENSMELPLEPPWSILREPQPVVQ